MENKQREVVARAAPVPVPIDDAPLRRSDVSRGTEACKHAKEADAQKRQGILHSRLLRGASDGGVRSSTCILEQAEGIPARRAVGARQGGAPQTTSPPTTKTTDDLRCSARVLYMPRLLSRRFPCRKIPLPPRSVCPSHSLAKFDESHTVAARRLSTGCILRSITSRWAMNADIYIYCMYSGVHTYHRARTAPYDFSVLSQHQVPYVYLESGKLSRTPRACRFSMYVCIVDVNGATYYLTL